MPVIGGKQPTVQISLPVPTPVASQPKQPKPQPIPAAAKPTLPPQPAGVGGIQPQQPTPRAFVFPWVPQQKRQFARKRDTDPHSWPQEFRSFIEQIKSKPVQGADGKWEWVSDDTARRVFADWLREKTGNASDPRAMIVERHTEQPRWIGGSPFDPQSGEYLHDLDIGRTFTPNNAYAVKGVSMFNGMTFEPVTSDENEVRQRFVKSPLQASHAIVTWRAALPIKRDLTGRAKAGRRREFYDFHAQLGANELHDLIDQLPETHKQSWREYANRFGLHDTRNQPQQMKRSNRPKRYMQDYDLLVTQARDAVKQGEGTNLGVLADYLEEHGLPGAHLARAGMKAVGRGVGNKPYPQTRDIPGKIVPAGRALTDPDSHAYTSLRIYPRTTDRGHTHMFVIHYPNSKESGVAYYVPVHSKEHLEHLIQDLDPSAQGELRQRMNPHLQDTHDPQLLKRSPRKYAGELQRSSGDLSNIPLPPGFDASGKTVPELLDAIHHWHARMIVAYQDLSKRYAAEGRDYHAKKAGEFEWDHIQYKHLTRKAMREFGLAWPEWAKENNGVPVPTDDDRFLAEDMVRSVTTRKPKQKPVNVTPEPAKQLLKRSPRRYAEALQSDVSNLLNQIASNPEHQVPGSNLRMVAADALDENARSEEANILRGEGNIFFHNGQVRGVPKHVAIHGRRWFRRSYGGTYHTAEVHIDGKHVLTTPQQYGYGDQYLDTAMTALEDAGLIPPRKRYDNGGHEPHWQWKDRHGINLETSAMDVRRERDLHRPQQMKRKLPVRRLQKTFCPLRRI